MTVSELVRNLKQMALKKRDEVSERTGKQPDLRGIMEWRAAAEIERLTAEGKRKDAVVEAARGILRIESLRKQGHSFPQLETALDELDRASGRRDLSTDRQPIDSDTSCKWVEVDEYDCTTWETDCGRKWEFMADGPVENDIKYCHGCGRSIELVDGRESK
jgi:hypothetical protein